MVPDEMTVILLFLYYYSVCKCMYCSVLGTVHAAGRRGGRSMACLGRVGKLTASYFVHRTTCTCFVLPLR